MRALNLGMSVKGGLHGIAALKGAADRRRYMRDAKTPPRVVDVGAVTVKGDAGSFGRPTAENPLGRTFLVNKEPPSQVETPKAKRPGVAVNSGDYGDPSNIQTYRVEMAKRVKNLIRGPVTVESTGDVVHIVQESINHITRPHTSVIKVALLPKAPELLAGADYLGSEPIKSTKIGKKGLVRFHRYETVAEVDGAPYKLTMGVEEYANGRKLLDWNHSSAEKMPGGNSGVRESFDSSTTPPAPGKKNVPQAGQESPIRELDAGFVQTPQGQRVAVSPIAPVAGQKITPLREIVLDLSKSIGKRITTAKLRRGAGGTYFPGSTATTVRFAGDLDTTAHEVSHFLDDQFAIVAPWSGKRMRSPFDKELEQFWPFGSATKSGPRSTLRYKRAEGVAEWMRAWMVNPEEAARLAPEFTKHFEATVPEGTRAALRSFGDDIRTWAGASAHEQSMANIGWEPPSSGLFKWLRKGRGASGAGFELTWADRAQAAVQDALKPFRKAVDGSSPRAWGGCLQNGGRRALRRFIPTGVGRLFTKWWAACAAPVHPHGRGAVAARASSRSMSRGSSPRAWGGLNRSPCIARANRFIPTGVGRLGGVKPKTER